MRGHAPPVLRALADNWQLVSEPLAFRAAHDQLGACAVIDLPQFVPESKLIAVAIGMPTADVVVDARDAALKQREKAAFAVRALFSVSLVLGL
jgi:hypothetical protein